MAIVLDGTSGEQISGNLTFTGTGQRITGDMSNATIANRTLVQSSTTNGQTNLGLIPNGSSGVATFTAYSSPTDPSNSAYAGLQYNTPAGGAILYSGATGTGTLTPLYIYVGNSIQMTVATDGTITGTKGNLQLISGTAVSASGQTSIDFTGIPSWVKRITVVFNGLSLSGNSQIQIQLGTVSGVETTGYLGGGWTYNAITTSTSGSPVTGGYIASWSYAGVATIANINLNNWVISACGAATTTSVGNPTVAGSTKSTASTLDRVRITTINGTDTFDAGSVNIMYE